MVLTYLFYRSSNDIVFTLFHRFDEKYFYRNHSDEGFVTSTKVREYRTQTYIGKFKKYYFYVVFFSRMKQQVKKTTTK